MQIVSEKDFKKILAQVPNLSDEQLDELSLQLFAESEERADATSNDNPWDDETETGFGG